MEGDGRRLRGMTGNRSSSPSIVSHPPENRPFRRSCPSPSTSASHVEQDVSCPRILLSFHYQSVSRHGLHLRLRLVPRRVEPLPEDRARDGRSTRPHGGLRQLGHGGYELVQMILLEQRPQECQQQLRLVGPGGGNGSCLPRQHGALT